MGLRRPKVLGRLRIRVSHRTFDRSIPGYGAFMGKIDVDKMDLVKCALEAGVIDMRPVAWSCG